MHLINTRLVITGVREQCTIVIVIIIVMPKSKSKCMQSFCYYNLIVAECSAESIAVDVDVDVTYLTVINTHSTVLFEHNTNKNKKRNSIFFCASSRVTVKN